MTSNFSFSHNVVYPIWHLFFISNAPGLLERVKRTIYLLGFTVVGAGVNHLIVVLRVVVLTTGLFVIKGMVGFIVVGNTHLLTLGSNVPVRQSPTNIVRPRKQVMYAVVHLLPGNGWSPSGRFKQDGSL